MKLKQDPDDFQVEELTDLRPAPEGPFAFYRLHKRSWTTPDALAVIRRRWNIHIDRMAWGGLKDRHAATTQYFSIFRGPQRNLRHSSIQVDYLGQVREPYSAQCIRANRFAIVVRGIHHEAAQRDVAALPQVQRDGVPNYFDDQRFGSVGDSRDFIARRMVRGEFEGALRLALAEPYPYDRAAVKREKAILREHWGRWSECKAALPRSHARSLVDYLVHHPADFRGAVARLRPDLQGLFLSAYQSYLWNAILSRWIESSFPSAEVLPLELRLGDAPAPIQLTAEQRHEWHTARLPLPAARWPFDPAAPWATAAHSVLEREGIAWEELKIRGLRKPFFTKGERAAWCVPHELGGEILDDDRNAGKAALRLRFELPRGSYATLIVKRLVGESAGRE